MIKCKVYQCDTSIKNRKVRDR